LKVAGMGENGKVRSVKPDDVNNPDFLKIDRQGNVRILTGSFGDFQSVMIGEKMLTEKNRELFSNRLFVQGNLKYQHNKGSVPRTDELAGKSLDRLESVLIPQYEKKTDDLKTRISEL
jgi:hypothetical protein